MVKERRVFSPIQMPACFHGDLTIRIASHALHHANNTVPRTINFMKCGAGLSDFRQESTGLQHLDWIVIVHSFADHSLLHFSVFRLSFSGVLQMLVERC